MSKSNKQRKVEARAAEDARKLTTGKVLRLVLKTLAFAIVVSLLVVVLQRFIKPFPTWLQYVLMLAVYIAAYPVLMSEFRVRHARR